MVIPEPMRRAALAMLLVPIACGSGEPDVVTGGFDESVVDRFVNEGHGVRIADLDGDGKVEIIGTFGITAAVIVYAQPEDPTSTWERIPVSGLVALSATDVEPADIDGDGDIDIAAISRHQRNAMDTSAGEFTWFENPGDIRGVWKTRVVTGETLLGPESLGAADIDGDGDVDFVVGTRTLTIDMEQVGGGLFWFSNDGNGAGFTGPIGIDPGYVADQIEVADVDADGRPDIVAASGIATSIDYFRNTSTSTSVGRFVRYTVAAGAQYSAVRAANLDADDQLEIVGAGTLMGIETSTLTITRHDFPDALGNDWTPTTVVEDLRSSPAVDRPNGPRLALEDLDGDGRDDVVISTAAPGDLRVYFDVGTGYELNEVRGGYTGIQYIATGDVDGDGRPDLVTNTSGFGQRDRIAWWRNVGPFN